MEKKKTGPVVVLSVIGIYLLIPLFFTFLYSLFSEWMDIMPKGFTCGPMWRFFLTVRSGCPLEGPSSYPSCPLSSVRPPCCWPCMW